MKKLFIFLLLAAAGTRCFGQKPVIDSTVFGKWPDVILAQISNNGQYTCYTIDNMPAGSATLVIRAVSDDWQLKVPGASAINARFTDDSKHFVFSKGADSLGIVTLASHGIEYMGHISSFKLSDRGNILAFKNQDDELVVRDLSSAKDRHFAKVEGYWFSNNGGALLLAIKGDTLTSPESLQWLTLDRGSADTIWRSKPGEKVDQVCFDPTGSQLAFITGENNAKGVVRSLWRWKVRSGPADLVITDHTADFDAKLAIGEIQSFTPGNTGILVTLNEKPNPQPKGDYVKVDVWSYSDAKLQSLQLNRAGSKNYLFLADLKSGKLIRIQQENETTVGSAGSFILTVRRRGNADPSEQNWNPDFNGKAYLFSLKTGEKKALEKIPVGSRSLITPALSASGKYVIWYDPGKRNYMSYSVASGTVKNMTNGVSARWTIKTDEPDAKYMPIPVAGWLKDDQRVFLYDQNDIWQVDPSGHQSPVNITNGYGRKHHIVFRFLPVQSTNNVIENSQKAVLTAFNTDDKQKGFYSAGLKEHGDPRLLIMNDYAYIQEGLPVKARDTSVWIITRQSATQSWNFFCTSDFKTFRQLSAVSPEKQYNWLTAELLTWNTLDGKKCQGVLYKPENFDPCKKYPVIFLVYDHWSDELNYFKTPGPTPGEINVPYFVSNGYLVFLPDIHYRTGYIGESVLNSVVPAARYLAKKPWVNPGKMAITGHSFGSYETDYIITHTHIFAAACSASGAADLVSFYGVTWFDGASIQAYFEQTGFRTGATLYDRPDLYIKNSPIFSVKNVSTPVLLMNNKLDESTPYAQGIEFFIALRRLGKKAWLLQYDDEGHNLLDPKPAADFTIRTKQFLDHYLKDAPAPKWMIEGIPARLKGIDDGLELEPPGVEPGTGLLKMKINDWK